MRKLEFIGSVRSNQGEFSRQMVIPGRPSLVIAPTDWPTALFPGTLNIAVSDDGVPKDFDRVGEGDGVKKFDKGDFKPEFAIPPWRITGNTLQPTPDEPVRGSAQVWLAELEVLSTGQMATCWMIRRLGSDIVSEIELVSDEDLRHRLSLTDGTVVKVRVWEAEPRAKLKSAIEVIEDWCEAAENIDGAFGTEKAMGYLVGEKFLNSLEAAETNAEWREAIPEFVTRIKARFEPWKLSEFLTTPRRLGALGHTASEEAHDMFRDAMDESEKLEEDARNLTLLSQAQELLLEE